MSTMSFLLVFLLCLRVANAYVLYAKDPSLGGASDGPTSMTDAKSIAETFVADFKKDLFSTDPNIGVKKFSEKFKFNGCKGVYGKREAFAFFILLQKDSSASVTLKKVAFFRNSVGITVAVDGFTAFLAQLTLKKENGDYVLTEGKIVDCPSRSRFY